MKFNLVTGVSLHDGMRVTSTYSYRPRGSIIVTSRITRFHSNSPSHRDMTHGDDRAPGDSRSLLRNQQAKIMYLARGGSPTSLALGFSLV